MQYHLFVRRLLSFAITVGALSLVSCNVSPVADRFDDSGEIIALSGSDAGAQSACHTCHGLDGSGDGALVPRIAGLDAGYLVRQLEFYANGQRTHAQMNWLASRLNSEERLAVAQYYAAMPWPGAGTNVANAADQATELAKCTSASQSTIYQIGAPSRGLSSCASCHAADGSGVGRGNPSLVGQSAAYLEEQLRRWRSGKRYGDPQGVMHKAASKLREEEITPLAEYIAYGLAQSGRRESLGECLRPRRLYPRSDV